MSAKTATQSQYAVSAYFPSRQILPFGSIWFMRMILNNVKPSNYHELVMYPCVHVYMKYKTTFIVKITQNVCNVICKYPGHDGENRSVTEK